MNWWKEKRQQQREARLDNGDCSVAIGSPSQREWGDDIFISVHPGDGTKIGAAITLPLAEKLRDELGSAIKTLNKIAGTKEEQIPMSLDGGE